MGNQNRLSELLGASMEMTSGGVIDGVEIVKAEGENTYQFAKFLTILGQVCRYILPKLEDRQYEWKEVIEIVKESGVLSLRAKKHTIDGETKWLVSDDDVVSIIEAVRWSTVYKATGVSEQIVPMIVVPQDNNASITVGFRDVWNTFAIRDAYNYSPTYDPYYLLTGKPLKIAKVGKTVITPEVTGKMLDDGTGVSVKCPICGNVTVIYMDAETLNRIQSGSENISPQNFPKLNSFEREALISHMCFDCQEKTFHRPAPGHEEAWGKPFAECDVCGSTIWDPKDRNEEGKLICHCCNTPYGLKEVEM